MKASSKENRRAARAATSYTWADTEAKFVKDFDTRYKGRRVLKTSYHFFNWCTMFNGEKSRELSDKFCEYCRRTRARATWRNAVEWYCTGKVVAE